MEHLGGPAQPSPSIAMALRAGLPWLEMKCQRCQEHNRIDLETVRRPPKTPIHILEESVYCRSCSFFAGWRPKARLVKLADRPLDHAQGPWIDIDRRARHVSHEEVDGYAALEGEALFRRDKGQGAYEKHHLFPVLVVKRHGRIPVR